MTRRSYPETECQDQQAKADHEKWSQGQKLSPTEQSREKLQSNTDGSALHATMIGSTIAVSLVLLYLLALLATNS
jgi:hypothetical protein